MHLIMESFRRPLVQVFFFKSSASYIKNNIFLFPDCLYGTFGVECRNTCNCKGGICHRETGACLTLPFFAKIASKLKNEPQAGKSANGLPLTVLHSIARFLPHLCHRESTFSGAEVGSGEVQSTDQHTDPSSPPKRLAPRWQATHKLNVCLCVNVALTYKRSANLYFMILNCDKLF